MARKTGLNDELNLKALIQKIVSFVKAQNKIQTPDTITKLLDMLISGIDSVDVSAYPFIYDEIKPRKRGKNKSEGNKYAHPTVSDLQKVLSGNVTLDKLELFSKLVHVGAYDDLFRKNLEPLVREIEQCDPSNTFFFELLNLCDPWYFSPIEFTAINLAIDKKDFVGLLIVLLRHGFDNLENIPAYFGQRAYEQAQTFDYDSPVRYELMKQAADGGIAQACLEYANYLAKRDDYSKPLSEKEIPRFEEALHYFLLANGYAPALWNIGFILEKYNIPKKTVSHINQTLRINTKLKELDSDLIREELDIIKPSPKSQNPNEVALAYKIHFYLAFKKDPFAKSFNSLSNMLYSGKIIVADSTTNITSEMLAAKYRKLAANRQDVVALTNMGSSWVKKLLAGDDSFETDPEQFLANMQLLELAASMKMSRALYNLAVAESYLISETASKRGNQSFPAETDPVQIMNARALLLEALHANQEDSRIAGELYYRLGTLESPRNEPTKTEYFKRAAEMGYPDAIYEISLRQYLKARNDGVALGVIRENLLGAISQMLQKKVEATELISQIEAILNSQAQNKSSDFNEKL